MCRFTHQAQVIRGDVFQQLKRLGEGGRRFSLILADPPFKQLWRGRIAAAVSRYDVLEPEGTLIIEHESHDTDDGNHGLSLVRQKQFGQSMVSIYTKGCKK